jgi:acylphosphatase
MHVTKNLRITGRVQGIGFRDAMVVEAIAIGVRGWVRNRADGSVEAVVVGDDAAVQRLITWARRGPDAARVDHVTVTEMTSSIVPGRFEKRATL